MFTLNFYQNKSCKTNLLRAISTLNRATALTEEELYWTRLPHQEEVAAFLGGFSANEKIKNAKYIKAFNLFLAEVLNKKFIAKQEIDLVMEQEQSSIEWDRWYDTKFHSNEPYGSAFKGHHNIPWGYYEDVELQFM